MNNPCVFRVVGDQRRLCLNARLIRQLGGEIKGCLHKLPNVKAQVDGNRLHGVNITFHVWFASVCGVSFLFMTYLSHIDTFIHMLANG